MAGQHANLDAATRSRITQKPTRRELLRRASAAAVATALAFSGRDLRWNFAVAGPEIPGAPQRLPIVLSGGTVHPVSGPPIASGKLLFDKGKIVAVGGQVATPPNAETIDVTGKHVYPGLFDPYTNLGLSEIGAVDETIDETEYGQINPNARAIVAFHVESELIPVTRASGVLLTLIAPSGRHLAGRSSVVQLDGWTAEDMALRTDLALHVEWPSMRPQAEWLAEKTVAEQRAEERAHLRELREAVEAAAAYRQARRAPGSRQPIDARWESLLPVFDRKMPVIVYADDLLEIEAAVAFCQRWQWKTILLGGYDAPHCAALLKKYDVPVILTGVYRVPYRRSAPYDEPYTLPARLHEAGVKFCISASGALGAVHVRNLANNAAAAVGFGLPVEEALKAITLYPAQILGVADRVGSLEAGKDATLIVTDGDPLRTETLVLSAYVQGRAVDLSDRHQRLWKKYQQKPATRSPLSGSSR